jgi:putative transposase
MNEQEDREAILKAVLHHLYQDNTKSADHCRYNLTYHIVWIPKYRRSLMKGQFAVRLKQVLTQIAKEYGFTIIAQEVMPDHIHMLIEAPPKWAPAKIVGILKGVSSREMRKEFLPLIQKSIRKDHTLWARGYYVSCVGNTVTTGIVKAYIENQKKEVPYIQGELFGQLSSTKEAPPRSLVRIN